MYEEKREKFTVKDMILQILFVALFIFLLIWLFPTKGYISSKIDPLLDTIFNENVMTMKDSAKSYFTLERLPQNTGDKVKMTLQEMLDAKIILPFTDKYGKTCDTNNSYVEVTKNDDEYVMKVYLECSDQEDYILVHMGCYDYCSTFICENKDKPITDSCGNEVTPVVPDDKDDEDKTYVCEYVLKTNGYYTAWSDWSDWQTDKITAQKNVLEVKTKTETVTTQDKVLTGYEYVKFYDGTQPLYETMTVVTDKKETSTCVEYGSVTTTTVTYEYVYGAETYMGTFTTQNPVTSTASDRYELVSVKDIPCDSNCSITTVYTYKWYAKKITKVATNTTTETDNKVCTKVELTYEPIYSSVQVLTGYAIALRKTPVYTTKNINTVITYYASRSRHYVNGSSKTQWSNCCDNDLINAGWTLTGNSKEA